MRFRILGPLDAWEDERELDLGTGRQRALLTLLLLHAGEVVSTDRLIDDLWSQHPPASAGKLVQGYVSRLRRALPADSIVTRDSGYLLRATETDAAEFQLLVELGSEQPPAASAKTLRSALALWRGPPLAEFEYDDWAQTEIARLQELRLVALERRIAADLQLGDAEKLVPELEALVAAHPLNERLRALLMLALYRSGRQADALAAYTDARTRLVQELGIEPGPELQEMQRRILVQDPELGPPPRPQPQDDAQPEPARTPVLRRRSLLAAALAGVLAAAVAVPILALSSSGSKSPPAYPNAIGATAVGAVDPETGQIVGSAPLEAAPSAVAVGEGSVWATMPNRDSVSRIDEKTNTVEQTVGVGNGPAAVALGDGFAWVANSLDGTVSQIDPKANGGQVVARIPVGNGPTGIAYGLGGVWVANSIDRTVVRIDPATGKPDRPIPVESGADAIAVGDGAVWVTGETAGVLSRIDPATAVVTPINVGSGPVAVAAGPDAVWVANSRDDTVWRIDPATNRPTAIVEVGQGPSGIAVETGNGSIWVSNRLAGTLSKVDPATAKVVKTVPVEDLPQAVAAGAGTTYVAVQGSGTAHRGGTLRVAVANESGIYAAPLPNAIDPAQGYTSNELVTLTNDGLVGYARTGGAGSLRVVPDLAAALPTVTDGGRTYTFQLRPGIRYSTGATVSPADVRRGIERALLASDGQTPGSFFRGIVGAAGCMHGKRCDLSRGIATTTGSNTIVFRLAAPDPDFLYKLALPVADAVPADTPLHARLPLPATGPYQVTSINPDSKHAVVRLARNQRFRLWSAAAQPDGYPDRIVERYGYTGESAVRAVEHGAADITSDGQDQVWSPSLASMLRTRYSSRLYSAAIVATTAVWLNTRLAPFDDVRVRRALNYAADRNHLMNLAGGPGLAEVGCQLLTPNINGYRRYCPYTLHPNAAGTYDRPDVARARRLVAASGTKGQRVTVWFYDIPIGRRNSAYLVSVLRSLGYRASRKLIPHAEATWRPDRQAGVSGLVADFPSASDFFTTQLTCRSYDPGHPDANLNQAAFCDRHVDAEIAKARRLQITDPAAASELWSAIDRQVTRQAPWLVIRTQLAPDFVSRRTGNYTYCYLASQSGTTGACLDQLWVR